MITLLFVLFSQLTRANVDFAVLKTQQIAMTDEQKKAKIYETRYKTPFSDTAPLTKIPNYIKMDFDITQSQIKSVGMLREVNVDVCQSSNFRLTWFEIAHRNGYYIYFYMETNFNSRNYLISKTTIVFQDGNDEVKIHSDPGVNALGVPYSIWNKPSSAKNSFVYGIGVEFYPFVYNKYFRYVIRMFDTSGTMRGLMGEEENFAYTSFAFAAVTGFCIGGTALANVIGIPYTSKRLSLSNCLLISVLFEALGNVILSKFILLQTIKNTINFTQIYGAQNLRKKGFISLGSSLMATCLMMINVTIFALPLSSTYIAFSGMTGASLFVFGFETEEQNTNTGNSANSIESDERKNPNKISIVTADWLIGESLIWIFTPVLSVLLTYILHKAMKKFIFERQDARKRVIKITPYSIIFLISIVVTLPSFIILLVLSRLYMIRKAHKDEENTRLCTDIVDSLKFWSSKALLKAYFGDEQNVMRRLTQRQNYQLERTKLPDQIDEQESYLEVSKDNGSDEDQQKVMTQNQEHRGQQKQQFKTIQMYQQDRFDINCSENMSEYPQEQIPSPSFERNRQNEQEENEEQLQQRMIRNEQLRNSHSKVYIHSEKNKQKIDKLFKVPMIISTCLLAFAHGSNEVNVSAPCAAMIFLLNKNTAISDEEAYQGLAIGLDIANIYFLNKISKGKKFKYKKIGMAIGFIILTVVASALFSIALYQLISSLDDAIKN
ncbi:phosphate permease [Stylonychia lemnae]|uniref:Phosphate transporter n=1 Tax=Stylonychia lemnae TaxID=5949 RepID=A0A078AJI6_STYLE|nr:phosphate permease [Stylonychia lemnae]|eukprot:CDW80953.1 phosphate permease [Stylonychia lemnae]